ncbi:MAG: DUF4197 domain-containing protein, partial [Limisphaerales bacterium]
MSVGLPGVVVATIVRGRSPSGASLAVPRHFRWVIGSTTSRLGIGPLVAELEILDKPHAQGLRGVLERRPDGGKVRGVRMPAVRRFVMACLILGIVDGGAPARGDLLDFLGLRRKASSVQSLTDEQIAKGLKEALEVGVRGAVELLGRSDGFLKHADVRIPLPAGLQRTEAALRALGQDGLVDEFETSLNRAAEKAVPEAAEVLARSVKQ